jgi:hypothetical protein
MTTKKEYVERKGSFCPTCKSKEIVGQSVDIDGGEAFQECFCPKCGSSWTDRYALTGFQDLIKGDLVVLKGGDTAQ